MENFRIWTHHNNILGKGAGGIVYIGKDLETKQKIAAKHILGADSQKVKEENFDKLLKLSHKNLFKIHKIYQDEKDLWQIMEFCPHGNLSGFFQRTNPPFNEKFVMMQGIATGLKYLHKKNIIHRDIKPANILVASDNPIVVKLADFDVSKFLLPEVQTEMSTDTGTLPFKAPEFFWRNQGGRLIYGDSVDIFALGLTYLAMLQHNTGSKALTPRAEIQSDILVDSIGRHMWEIWVFQRQVVEVVRTREDTDTTGLMKLLIQRMTRFEPEDRPDVDSIVDVIDQVTKIILYTTCA